MIGGEVIIERNPEKKVCLQKDELLCDSIIWQMLQNYYKKAAINAWKENIVPSFVTSNSKLAKDYARVIINYIKDWFNSNECNRNIPVYILEVGAGHGIFTYLILRALNKYKKYFKSMNIPKKGFVYVFTDVARDNITYCMNNEYLKKFISNNKKVKKDKKKKNKDVCENNVNKKDNILDDKNEYMSEDTDEYILSDDTNDYLSDETDENILNENDNYSMLDFAFFDGNDTTDQIYLEIAKKNIPNNTPIVLICNYVLDSLLTDAWIIEGENKFKRALLSVYSPNKEDDITNEEIMLRMSLIWNWKETDIDNEIKQNETDKPSDYLRKYKDIYKVLKLYSYFDQYLSFVLPVGSFILFHRILKLTDNKLLCIIGDKGYQTHDEFLGYRNPHIVVHGSLSFMVNLNAICLFFLSLGGYYIYTPYSDTFQIIALLMHKKKDINDKCNKFDIINFFKKNINELNKSIKLNIHKKLKKINLQNLNNMTINFGSTVTSFSDITEQLPPDVLINWQKSVVNNINNNIKSIEIKELISLLRYSNYDSYVFCNMKNAFLQLACYPNINGRTEKDILLDIKECYKNHYSLKNDEDIADTCGHLCLKFGDFKKSIYYLKESIRIGIKNLRHYSSYLNIASCYKMMSKYEKALKYVNSAIKLENKKIKKDKTYIYNNQITDILYNIQFCINPITYAIIGVNYHMFMDGLYYFSFEPRFKIKYIFLLTDSEFLILKDILFKLVYTSMHKAQKNINWNKILIIKIYNNEIIYANDLLNILNKNKNKTEFEILNTDTLTKESEQDISEKIENVENVKKKKNGDYQNINELINNLKQYFEKYDFQLCIIDVPSIIKTDIVNFILDKKKHIYTYGNFLNSNISHLIKKYDQFSKDIAWLNNNSLHEEYIFEAKKSLKLIENIISISIVHYSDTSFTTLSDNINKEEILLNDICIIINALMIILNRRLSGINSNIFLKNDLNKNIQNNIPLSLSGIFIFSNYTSENNLDIYGNYLIINNINSEFTTKIKIIGFYNYLIITKTVTTWTINVFNKKNEKIKETSGRLSPCQNANDAFLAQYLVKTNGNLNNITHISNYNLLKKNDIENDSDYDILYISSDDENIVNDKILNEKEQTNKTIDQTTNVKEHNEIDNFKDNIINNYNENMNKLSGIKFYDIQKKEYENMNLDSNFVDISVNYNLFYSKYIEGIKLSNQANGKCIVYEFKEI